MLDTFLGLGTKTLTVTTALEVIPESTDGQQKLLIGFLVAIITQLTPDIIKFIKSKLKTKPNGNQNRKSEEIDKNSIDPSILTDVPITIPIENKQL